MIQELVTPPITQRDWDVKELPTLAGPHRFPRRQ